MAYLAFGIWTLTFKIISYPLLIVEEICQTSLITTVFVPFPSGMAFPLSWTSWQNPNHPSRLSKLNFLLYFFLSPITSPWIRHIKVVLLVSYSYCHQSTSHHTIIVYSWYFLSDRLTQLSLVTGHLCWIQLLSKCYKQYLYLHPCVDMFSFLSGIHPEVELLGHLNRYIKL